MLKNHGEKLWMSHSSVCWLKRCPLTDSISLLPESTQLFLTFPTLVPLRPGHMGSPASSIWGYCPWMNEWASYCCHCQPGEGHCPGQGATSRGAPSFQLAGAQRVLGLLQTQMSGWLLPRDPSIWGRLAAQHLPRRPMNGSAGSRPLGAKPWASWEDTVWSPRFSSWYVTVGKGEAGQALASPAENSLFRI